MFFFLHRNDADGRKNRIFSIIDAIKQAFAASDMAGYLKIASLSALGLGLLLIFSWTPRTTFVWVPRHFIPVGRGWSWFVITFPVSHLLSIPAAFVLWLYAWRRDYTFTMRFSFTAFLASYIGFMVAAGLNASQYRSTVMCFALLGTLAGLAVFIDIKQLLRPAMQDWKLTLIALLTASISALYNLLENQTWERLCRSTASMVYWLLHSFGFEIGLTIGSDKNHIPITTISSKAFVLQVYRPCSGMEGIFLFLFLLSAIFVIDWPLFKRSRIIEIYLIGIIYMFLVNVLRIASLYALGYFAWQPDASAFMQSLRATPIEIFHSVAGEIYDFIAFVFFALVLYRNAAKKPKISKINKLI